MLIVLGGAPSVFAQSVTIVQYSMGFATGDLNDFIGSPSFRGITVDYRKMVRSDIGVGFELGWNVFYDARPFDTYSIGNLSYSGKQWRYNNQFPILASIDYYLNPGERINPFAGLGLGTMYSFRYTDMGQFRFQEEAWHFALRPEVGVLIEASPGIGFAISGNYSYGFEAGDLNAQSYFALTVGFDFAK
jgi:hypothetical protein